jgi:uncharacterized protein (TIGR02452 family)
MVQTTLSGWKSNGFKSQSSKPKGAKPHEERSPYFRANASESKSESSNPKSSESTPNTTPVKLGNSRFHNQDLRATCHETKEQLLKILTQLPNLRVAASTFHHMRSDEFRPLRPDHSPGYVLSFPDNRAGRKGTRIRVYNQDSFDAALELQPGTTVSSILSPTTSTSTLGADQDTAMTNTSPPPTTSTITSTPKNPVAVLNLASERYPGGGWENGTLAQEEALCYRSSLYRSLHRSYYPLPLLAAVYTPNCLLIRSSLSSGHRLLTSPPADLPVTSVITVAALRHPEIDEYGGFAHEWDRETTKTKIRGTLRLAVLKGHTKIVLGALGCGAFGNPPEDVAQCFVEVFEMEEFKGKGWFEDVVFAIIDNAKGSEGGKHGVGNYGIFYRALDGMIV